MKNINKKKKFLEKKKFEKTWHTDKVTVGERDSPGKLQPRKVASLGVGGRK